MRTSVHEKQESATQRIEALEFGLAREEDMDAAAKIYVQNFPQRARHFFRAPEHGIAFYRDLMESMRLSYGPTFFAAWDEHRLAGYLILTMPGRGILGPALRKGFLLRAAGHALTGKYGAAPRFFLHAAGALLGVGSGKPGKRFSGLPHVYVIAVAENCTGRGIGTALQQRARKACEGKFDRMWLSVERENTSAIRFYERLGFCIVESDALQHTMVWEFHAENAKD